MYIIYWFNKYELRYFFFFDWGFYGKLDNFVGGGV